MCTVQGKWLASYQRLLKLGEEKAWCTLFAVCACVLIKVEIITLRQKRHIQVGQVNLMTFTYERDRLSY